MKLQSTEDLCWVVVLMLQQPMQCLPLETTNKEQVPDTPLLL
jgi:hypothetical protein